MQLRKLVGSAILLFSTWATAQSVRTDYPASGALLGIGWRSAIGEQADATCVEFSPTKTTADNAQSIRVDVHSVQSTEHFYSLTDTSSSVLLKKAVGSGVTFRTRWIDSVTVDSDKQTYVVTARVDNPTEFTSPPDGGELKVKDKYLDVLMTKGLNAFVKICGDSFVFRRYGGAELIGTAETIAFTREDKSKATVNWSGSALAVKLEGELNTEENLKKFTEELKFSYFLGGGSGAQGAVDKEGLKSLVTSLSSLAVSAPQYWLMDLRSYADLSNWPDNQGYPSTSDALHVLSARYASLREVLRIATTAIARQDDYIVESYQQENLKIVKEDVRALLVKIEELAKSCLGASKSSCSMAPEDQVRFDDVQFRIYLPIRKRAIAADKRYEEINTKLAALAKDNDSIYKANPWLFTCEQLLNPPPPPTGGISIPPPNTPPAPEIVRYADNCRTQQAALKDINSLVASRPMEIRQGIFAIRVRDVVDVRCSLDLTSPLCISEADMEKTRQRLFNAPIEYCVSLEKRIQNMDNYKANSPQHKSMIDNERKALVEEAEFIGKKFGYRCAGRI